MIEAQGPEFELQDSQEKAAQIAFVTRDTRISGARWLVSLAYLVSTGSIKDPVLKEADGI